MPKNCDFWVFIAIWDVVRAQNFFTIVFFVIKSRCNFFCLIIAQKFIFLEQFEVWWKFLKFRFFSKILKFFKIFEKSSKNAIFRWKKSNYDELQRNVFRWVLELQMWLKHKKASILFEHFILKNYITARAFPRALWSLEYSTYCARDIFPIFVKICARAICGIF